MVVIHMLSNGMYALEERNLKVAVRCYFRQ